MWGCIYIWFGYKPLPPHDLNVQVIYALTAHLKKTHTDAVALATFVDRKVSLVTIVCWCMILLICLYKCNISVYLFCSPVALYVDAFCKCVVLVVLTLPLPSPPLPSPPPEGSSSLCRGDPRHMPAGQGEDQREKWMCSHSSACSEPRVGSVWYYLVWETHIFGFGLTFFPMFIYMYTTTNTNITAELANNYMCIQ